MWIGQGIILMLLVNPLRVLPSTGIMSEVPSKKMNRPKKGDHTCSYVSWFCLSEMHYRYFPSSVHFAELLYVGCVFSDEFVLVSPLVMWEETCGSDWYTFGEKFMNVYRQMIYLHLYNIRHRSTKQFHRKLEWWYFISNANAHMGKDT